MKDFTFEVLALLDELDLYSEPVFWRCEGESITFLVLCNDVFYWATADAEPLTADDMPALRQALKDVEEIIGTIDRYIGFELWVARKRSMRPQKPAYPMDARLHYLFDACGPVRTAKEEG